MVNCISRIFITVCPQGSWGDNCTETCTCMEANTETCDTTTGFCTCKSGWQAANCDIDIDECDDAAVHQCPGNSTCQDTEGSFFCQCNTGFFKASDGNCQGRAYCLREMKEYQPDFEKQCTVELQWLEH